MFFAIAANRVPLITRAMSGTILVCGGGGFIGHHLVARFKSEGSHVVAADLTYPRYGDSPADTFLLGDLSDRQFVERVFDQGFDEIYQLAADMGGAGYVFTGRNDATIMRNSATINLNVLEAARTRGCGRIFFSSSACVYPELGQTAGHAACREASAYPAAPDSEYGWEKLFAERLYAAYARNYGMTVRVARYHNVFGPLGSWNNGREKAPAALCRKVALADPDGTVEIWGDGQQTRSFLYIDECVEGTIRLMRSAVEGPVNIGSDRLVSIEALVDEIARIAGKRISKRYVEGPTGVRLRCSNNDLISERLGWRPDSTLRNGLETTYRWIAGEVGAGRSDAASSAA